MSELIARESLKTVDAWHAPHIDQAGAAPSHQTDSRNPPRLHSAAELEALQKQAWEEGRAEGLAAGRKAGLAEMRQCAQRFRELINALQQPLKSVDEEVEEELVRLALAVARQIIRRELRTDPKEVLSVVREALGELPSNSRDIRVILHPEDAALVRAHLQDPVGDSAWSIGEDPMIARGDCRITTATATVDASLETRLARIAVQIFGGERCEDLSDEDDVG